MLAARSEALALELALQTIQNDSLARKLRWRVAFRSDQSRTGYSRYGSTLEITGSDGHAARTASVPLFEDGTFVHTKDSLAAALLAAVSETTTAVQGPVAVKPIPRRRASDLLTA